MTTTVTRQSRSRGYSSSSYSSSTAKHNNNNKKKANYDVTVIVDSAVSALCAKASALGKISAGGRSVVLGHVRLTQTERARECCEINNNNNNENNNKNNNIKNNK